MESKSSVSLLQQENASLQCSVVDLGDKLLLSNSASSELQSDVRDLKSMHEQLIQLKEQRELEYESQLSQLKDAAITKNLEWNAVVSDNGVLHAMVKQDTMSVELSTLRSDMVSSKQLHAIAIESLNDGNAELSNRLSHSDEQMAEMISKHDESLSHNHILSIQLQNTKLQLCELESLSVDH